MSTERNLRPAAHRHQPDGDTVTSGLSEASDPPAEDPVEADPPEPESTDGAVESEPPLGAWLLVAEGAEEDAEEDADELASAVSDEVDGAVSDAGDGAVDGDSAACCVVGGDVVADGALGAVCVVAG
ncbi:MAG: hypothetical protein WAP49_07765 [Mycobacterium sp.]